MSSFQGANNFSIQTLNLLDGTSTPGASPGSRAHLYSKVVAGAIHDSSERCDAPKCHPETREAVQRDIIGWIRDEDQDVEPMKIMWITGPAGSGKTAIVGSVAETCDEDGLLAATFFFSSFSGSEDRRLKRGLITTLVHQLTQLDGMESVERHVLSAIQRNPGIFDKRLKSQMEDLVLKPLRDRHKSGAPAISAKVIIIDGLDEVEDPKSRQLDQQDARPRNEADQVEILCALHHAASNPTFPFRILIASRPERVIRDFFSGNANKNNDKICRKISLHDQYNADADIRLFLDAGFAEVRRRYHLSSSWPTEADLEQLVATASGQFIYAATVIRFLRDGKHPDPQALLTKVLYWRSQDDGVNGLAPLDALYTRILMSSPDPPLVTRWLLPISHQLDGEPALFTKQLLQDFEGQAEYLLENLASLIDIPQADLEDELPYRFFHKSFRDFLRSPSSNPLYPDFLGRCLFERRCVQIFRTQSPACPLPPGSEWRRFIDRFISLMDSGYIPFPDGSPDSEPPSYGVAWWVHTVDAFLAEEPRKAAILFTHLFDEVHYLCRRQYGRGCKRSCKVWRSGVLNTCKSLGWSVPNVMAQLRDEMITRMQDKLDIDVPGEGFPDLSTHFTPPVGREPPVRPPCPVVRSPDDRQVDDAQYESLCNTIDAICSRLPDGWEVRMYEEGTADALRSDIDRIKHELGIHEEDVEPANYDESDGFYDETDDGNENGIEEGSTTSDDWEGTSDRDEAGFRNRNFENEAVSSQITPTLYPFKTTDPSLILANQIASYHIPSSARPVSPETVAALGETTSHKSVGDTPASIFRPTLNPAAFLPIYEDSPLVFGCPGPSDLADFSTPMEACNDDSQLEVDVPWGQWLSDGPS